MSIKSQLEEAGGCAGGIAIYSASKAACEIMNANRIRRTLWRDTRRVMKEYFPKLNLSAVRFCINCNLPGNWFKSGVGAMTFGNTIFFDDTDYQKSRGGLRLLMHELVHVDQVRRKGGEIPFACAYGKGYLEAGNYRDNPLEAEAYDFVTEHGPSLPDGCKKD